MARSPSFGELSFRHDTAGDGTIAAARRALSLAYSDRFVVGSYAWVSGRWDRYDEIIAQYRPWLRQLPSEVAAKIASGNGARAVCSRTRALSASAAFLAGAAGRRGR